MVVANTNELRQTLLEFHEQRLQAHRQSLLRLRAINEAFTIGSTRYWRYRGQCWQAGPDGEPHEMPCDKYYALQDISSQSNTSQPSPSSALPTKPTKKKPNSSPKPSQSKSPRISPDRIKQVASQESFEVKAGKHTIPSRSQSPLRSMQSRR